MRFDGTWFLSIDPEKDTIEEPEANVDAKICEKTNSGKQTEYTNKVLVPLGLQPPFKMNTEIAHTLFESPYRELLESGRTLVWASFRDRPCLQN